MILVCPCRDCPWPVELVTRSATDIQPLKTWIFWNFYGAAVLFGWCDLTIESLCYPHLSRIFPMSFYKNFLLLKFFTEGGRWSAVQIGNFSTATNILGSRKVFLFDPGRSQPFHIGELTLRVGRPTREAEF